MRRPAMMIVTLGVWLSLLAAACQGTPTPPATTAPATRAASQKNFEDFDPTAFAESPSITNPWMPMTPGMRWVYEGTTVEDDGTVVPHRVEIHITDLTKVIDGVRSVVSWDLDYSDGQLVEAELAFFAQDMAGNVWRMGEYPEEYEDGQIIAAPAWIHGLAEAHAGIMMPAQPQLGTPSYSQGWAPTVGWTDRGQVDQMGQETCVPVDCYTDVLVIAETSQAEPGAQQLKYYAPGLGNIRVDWKGADATQEKLELISVEQLDPEALAEVRAKALELEQSAYDNSRDVYALTSPTEYPAGTPVLAITPAVAAPTPVTQPSDAPVDIIVYASDLPQTALFELDYIDDPASPGGKLIGLPNTGDELDPPPEDDPHVTFKAQVLSGVAYRCWIHMKVGAPQGKSQANVFWVQFTGSVDEANNELFAPGSGSYLTAEGPTREGWVWVECDRADSEAEPLVYFGTSGEVTIRLQAGMEGVGFDQFLLSPERYLNQPPSEAIVEK